MHPPPKCSSHPPAAVQCEASPRRWGTNVLIPFDGNILDGHFLRIRLQLHLEIENRFLFLQLARQSLTQVVRRSIFGRCRHCNPFSRGTAEYFTACPPVPEAGPSQNGAPLQ